MKFSQLALVLAVLLQGTLLAPMFYYSVSTRGPNPRSSATGMGEVQPDWQIHFAELFSGPIGLQVFFFNIRCETNPQSHAQERLCCALALLITA